MNGGSMKIERAGPALYIVYEANTNTWNYFKTYNQAFRFMLRKTGTAN